MAATPNPYRQQILARLLQLYRELGDRIDVTGHLSATITGEWATPPYSSVWSWSELEPLLVECVRGRGIGSKLDQMGRNFAAWRDGQKARYGKTMEELQQKYMASPEFKAALKHALEKVKFPEVLDFCDDVAVLDIREDAKLDPGEALPLAKANRDKYLVTWTHALLTRVAQYAQTIPTGERARGPFGGYAKLLKADENDFTDAALAALGVHCGLLITEDGGLRERINFLHKRGFIRLQAMEFSDVEANWHPPGWTPDAPDAEGGAA